MLLRSLTRSEESLLAPGTPQSWRRYVKGQNIRSERCIPILMFYGAIGWPQISSLQPLTG